MGFGFGTAAGSFGQFLFTLLASALIAGVGWQTTALIFAGLMLLVLPLSIPLATRGADRANSAVAPIRDQSIRETLAEAFATPSYWLLLVGFFTCGFHLAFITAHLPPFLIDNGVPFSVGGWALALTVYLFALTPIDHIVTGANVRRILAGDSAPAVQIAVHPIGPEGVPQLLELLECDDEIVREGVRAMLSVRREEAQFDDVSRDEEGWTAYQFAEQRMLRRLDAARGQWANFDTDIAARDLALERFRKYADKWY